MSSGKNKFIIIFMLMIGVAMATHAPNPSHAANAVTIGTFLDNYTVNGTFNFTNNIWGRTLDTRIINISQVLDVTRATIIGFDNALLLSYSNLTGIISLLERGNFTSGFNAQIILANETKNLTEVINFTSIRVAGINITDAITAINNSASHRNATNHILDALLNAANLTNIAFLNNAITLTATNISGMNNALTLNASNITSGSFTGSFNFLTGNVGIGTTAPFARLMINGTTPALQVNDSVYLAVLGGLVGIGTTNPAAVLHISGNLRVVGGTNITGNVSINGSLWQPFYGSDDGLVLYYSFSQRGGSTAFDQSPYFNDGSLNGLDTSGTATSGWNRTLCKTGWCMQFDGTDDFISIPNDGSTNFGTGPFSISVWVRTTSTNSATIIETSTSPTVFTEMKAFRIENSGTNIAFYARGGSNADLTVNVNINDGIWHHVVGTYVDSERKLYMDGVLLGNVTVSMTTTDTTTAWRVGSALDGTLDFTGFMDELRIYNRSLSSDEIRTQYLNGLKSIGTALSLASYRIITNGAERMRISSSGNVGIGTTAPLSLLHVKGDIRQEGGSIFLYEDTFPTVRQHSISHGHSDGSNPNNFIAFSVSDGSGVTAERMRINGAGNVGIGTTAPYRRLQINGTGGVSLEANESVYLATGGTTQRVSIGSTTPGNYKLNVVGSVNATDFTTNGTDYAEFIFKRNASENITAGNIVGIYEGKAAKNTTGASSFMIVSGSSAGIIAGGSVIETLITNYTVLINTSLTRNTTRLINTTLTNITTNETYTDLVNTSIIESYTDLINTTLNRTIISKTDDFTNYEKLPVAFAGQIRVNVNGTVNDGDWIIPDGNNGYGKAVNIESAPNLITGLKWIRQKICTAWESKGAGLGTVNCAIKGA